METNWLKRNSFYGMQATLAHFEVAPGTISLAVFRAFLVSSSPRPGIGLRR